MDGKYKKETFKKYLTLWIKSEMSSRWTHKYAPNINVWDRLVIMKKHEPIKKIAKYNSLHKENTCSKLV